MRKISSIKLLFVILPIVIIALLLFMRWNDYGRSYKSLADWANGNWMSNFAADYYKKQINRIITDWQKAGKEYYVKPGTTKSFLHFDLDNKSLWLEENGVVEKENLIKFNYDSVFYRLNYFDAQNAIDLPKRVVLQIQNPNENLSGQFSLYFWAFLFNFDKTTCTDGNYASITTSNPIPISTQQSIDYKSMIVSEDEYKKYKKYKKYKESLETTNPTQSSQFDISEEDTLKKNRSTWLKAEKQVILEIYGQLKNAGYQLDSLEIETGMDYTDAHAIILGHGKNIIEKILNDYTGTITIRAYLEIDYIGNNIWYVKTAPNSEKKLDSDRKLNLEFLVFPEEQIPRLQYRKYIKQGRKVQQSKE